jgi:hypothetical protein
MKMLLTAIAFAIATPAAAQNAPADLHANHAAHAAQTPAQPAAAGRQGSVPKSADPHGHAMSGCCSNHSGKQMACCKNKQEQANGGDCCEGNHAEHGEGHMSQGADGTAPAPQGSDK